MSGLADPNRITELLLMRQLSLRDVADSENKLRDEELSAEDAHKVYSIVIELSLQLVMIDEELKHLHKKQAANSIIQWQKQGF